MRRETVTYEIFKFSELSEDVQKEVIEAHRTHNVEDINWWECTYDMWYERLEAMGFDNAEINFSGFWSQGDGASFTCPSVNVSKLMDCLAFNTPRYKSCLRFCMLQIMADRGGFDNVSIKRFNHHYVHQNSCEANIEVYYERQRVKDAADNLESILNSTIKRLNNEIYKSLEKEYNYLTSDECIKEMLLADDYEFLSNGKVWR